MIVECKKELVKASKLWGIYLLFDCFNELRDEIFMRFTDAFILAGMEEEFAINFVIALVKSRRADFQKIVKMCPKKYKTIRKETKDISKKYQDGSYIFCSEKWANKTNNKMKNWLEEKQRELLDVFKKSDERQTQLLDQYKKSKETIYTKQQQKLIEKAFATLYTNHEAKKAFFKPVCQIGDCGNILWKIRKGATHTCRFCGRKICTPCSWFIEAKNRNSRICRSCVPPVQKDDEIESITSQKGEYPPAIWEDVPVGQEEDPLAAIWQRAHSIPDEPKRLTRPRSTTDVANPYKGRSEYRKGKGSAKSKSRHQRARTLPEVNRFIL